MESGVVKPAGGQKIGWRRSGKNTPTTAEQPNYRQDKELLIRHQT